MIKVVFIDWYKTLSSSVFWQQLSTENIEAYNKITDAYQNELGDKIVPWMKGELDT